MGMAGIMAVAAIVAIVGLKRGVQEEENLTPEDVDAQASTGPEPAVVNNWCQAPIIHYPGMGAEASVCHRPNSFPCGSVQVANQPISGTGIGSLACPPNSRTRSAPAPISSTLK